MITLNRTDLNRNLECPFHEGEYFFANGCGGKDSWVNSLVQTLPSSELFYGPCIAHDILYSLVSASIVLVKHNDAHHLLKIRKDVDLFWLQLMNEIADKQPWYNRWAYKHAAMRNYKFVRQFGLEYFTHTHRKTK